MIIEKNGNYVVSLPDHFLYQDIDPADGSAFTTAALAQTWQDNYLAAITAAQTASDAAAAQAEHDKLSAETHLEITAPSLTAAIGAPVNFSATLKDGHGVVIPLTQTFAVPIESNGAVSRIKGVNFVNGVANVSITFDRSGYYQVTEAGINSRDLPLHIALPVPFELTVYE